MKRIGIIGGMSYESTLPYYEQINRKVNARYGDLTSADLVLRSVNFAEYYRLMQADNWEAIGNKLQLEAINLVTKDHCDYIAIATNTMHKVAHRISGIYITDRGYLPLVHIGDCVAEKCQAANVRNVALLGTKFTMTEPFMKQRLEQNGLTVINDLPAEAVNEINRIIFGELCHGKLTQESQNYLHSLCTHLAAHKLKDNIDGIILGCTELQMALDDTFEIYLYSNYGVKLFDTTQAHINKLVDLCLLSD